MDNKVGILISVFISLLVGLVLIGELGDVIYSARTLSSVTNESLTFAAGINTTTTAQDDLSSVSFFGNGTKDHTANLTRTVNWTSGGTITIDGVIVSNGLTYNISYLYEGDGYVTHATSRTLILLLVIFFAIAILLGAVWYVMNMLPKFK